MITIFLFEMKKIFKSTFIIITLLLFCLFIFGYYIFVYFNTVRADEIVVELESKVDFGEKHLQELNDLLSNDKENRQLQQDIQFKEELITRDKVQLKAYQNEDWFTVLNEEINMDGGSARVSSSNFIHRTYTHPTTFTSETRFYYHEWMRDRSIQPVLPLGINSWMTIYDVEFGGDTRVEQFVKDSSSKYSSSGIHFLHHVFQLLFGLFGAVIFLLLLGDIITKEGLGKNGPIHLLKTQPIHPFHILSSKLLASLTATILIFIGTSLLAILLGTVVDRFGNVDYPVLIYGENLTYNFMEMGTFLLQSALLFFMVLLFCYSLLFLFSIITKRAILAVGLVITSLLIGIQWSEQTTLSTLAPYTPFHYFSVSEVITKELAVNLENFDFSFTTGLIVLSVYSILFYFLTYLISFFQDRFSY